MSNPRTRRAGSSRRYARRNHLNGRRFHVPSHPAEFVSQPWFNMVLRLQPIPPTVTPQTMQVQLSLQTGLSFPGGIVDLRIYKMRAWSAIVSQNATTTLQPLSIVINDPIGATTLSGFGGIGVRTLEQLTAYPDQVNRASLGYSFSEAQRNFVTRCVGAGSTTIYPLFVSSGVAGESVMYLDIVWRAPGVLASQVTGHESGLDWSLECE